jgi:hypothetical protein
MNIEQFKKTAAEFLQQVVEELEALEILLLEKREPVKGRCREIFQISQTPQCEEAAFDLEGDDDILHLSFRGDHVDIKRSKLTKSKLGRNLFSCLFKKHWDGFHVRDKEGRIYIDLKYAGFKSMLNCLKGSGNISIPNNHNVYHSLNCFKLLNLFNSLIGLENSQIYLPL